MGDEESWTFIGDDCDPELVRRLAESSPTTHVSHGDSPNRALVSGATSEVNLMGKEG